MKVRLLNRSQIRGMGVVDPGDYDLEEEQLNGMRYELLEPVKKPRAPRRKAETDVETDRVVV